MDVRRLSLILLVCAVLLVVPAVPARAHHEGKDRKSFEVEGVIVAVAHHQRAFLLQEIRPGPDRFWAVRLHPRVEVRAGFDDDDDDDDAVVFIHLGSWLRVGQWVEVEGQLLGNGQVLAREIRFGRRKGRGPIIIVPPGVQPPVTVPPGIQPPPGVVPPGIQPPVRQFPTAPQILFPPDGTQIAAGEFTVVGRTLPGAVVRVEVTLEVFGLQFPLSASEVVADVSGFFTHPVRPSVRIAGALYRITVRARFNGILSPPASVVVRQL